MYKEVDRHKLSLSRALQRDSIVEVENLRKKIAWKEAVIHALIDIIGSKKSCSS